ncbi:MAG: alpha/beta fold hydrolase [bacterium]
MQAERHFITVDMGEIATYINYGTSDKTPIIFLHGVYFDHHMWDEYLKGIIDRTIICIDMPFHGESKTIHKRNWNLHDCAIMLIQLLDRLNIKKVIAVGHSWGSMTILRSAHFAPERFESILLCNMPFQKATQGRKLAFKFQHPLLAFKRFYIKQVGKALFGPNSLKKKPELIHVLIRTMNLLSAKEIKHIDMAVIIDAEDTTNLLSNLAIPTIAIKGEDDYVPIPPHVIDARIVKGGHISPLENIEEVQSSIQQLLR